jgi:Xaa-Pro aminopeptidase
MIAKMCKENRAALLDLLKSSYKKNPNKSFPKKSLLYLKGSVERSRHDDDVNHQTHYEPNFSYLVGFNCVYYDSVIDFETDEVFLVDILNYYQNNKWVQGVTPKQMKEYQLSGVIQQDQLSAFIKSKDPEQIFINRGVARSNERWSHHWVPDQMEEFRNIMNFDMIYPMVNLARTKKNPTEIKLMREVRSESSFKHFRFAKFHLKDMSIL